MALLAAIVADKTGYPAEMLRPEMALEADLGIDSIKRVEILSAMRDAVPELRRPRSQAPSAPCRPSESVLPTSSAPRSAARANGAPAKPPTPAAVTSGKASARACLRLVVDWTERAAPGLSMPALFSCKRIVVVEDAGGVGIALATHLAALGLPAVAVPVVDDEADGIIDVRALDPVADAAE